RVKETASGTTTNGAGNFELQADPQQRVWVFSLVGYQEQEVTLKGQTVVNVTLQEGQEELSEVVVIGYQTVRRQDLTGATGIINTANAQRTVSRSLPESIQGLAPGIAVRNGGAPGQEAVVNIRGLSTFTGNANPLYVID